MTSDPIAQLMEEHQQFLRRIGAFRLESRSIASGPRHPDAGSGYVREFAHFLAEDVDRLHGRKEELGLFPVLGRYIGLVGGPIPVMIEEHEEVRRHHDALARDASKLESDPEHREALLSVADVGAQVEALLASHIEKEDAILFPLAREVIPPSAMLEVAQVCEEIELEVRSTRSPGH